MSQHHEAIKNKAAWHAARLACFERDGFACVDCGAEDDLEADHVIPLSAVLADPETEYLALDLDNLATRCKPCNGAKAAKHEGQVTRGEWINPAYPEVLLALQ